LEHYRGKKKSNEVWHHIIARSKGGLKKHWNIHKWEYEREKCWHRLFHTDLPSACIIRVQNWQDQNGNLDQNKMTRGDIDNFEMVFGHKNPGEAIKFIEENFLPAEIKFLEEKKEEKK